ncbi:MAG: hypothetical protein AABY54_09340 [Deltaproteobacteria bacterium]
MKKGIRATHWGKIGAISSNTIQQMRPRGAHTTACPVKNEVAGGGAA